MRRFLNGLKIMAVVTCIVAVIIIAAFGPAILYKSGVDWALWLYGIVAIGVIWAIGGE